MHRKEKVIDATPLSIGRYTGLMAEYRSLIWVFAKQELKAMYAQTYLGIVWAVIRPLFTVAVFTVIFRYFLKVPTQSPYYLFAFTGMVGWNLFSQIALGASNAVAQRQDLIRKMYFPKLVLPLSKVIVALVEAGISFGILLILVFVEQAISCSILYLAFFVGYNIVCGLLVAVWMNAVTIRFRDLNQVLPTAISIGIWITPVFYPTTIIPQQYNFLLYLNPLAGVVKGYRFALLGEPAPEPAYYFTMVLTLLLLIAGIWYFVKTEDQMVDYV